MSPSEIVLPSPSELYSRHDLVARHPHLLNEHRVTWAGRKRHENGLSAAGGVFESPCGELLYHEPSFLRWFLGLSGRGKPRGSRRPRRSAASASAGAL